ncbi:PEP-CTERM sorting domain-containing protein [Pseudoduganella violaceinigra]|uniref:PEP-CTERM sorting domain-containing protein n=1 Tax=Pseudoduganella violaceinigra TaxID=246602 RepID=UPI0004857334|nr:PEP-CTERM sorting domain-containing protein [Pseudoduganella violaceinigra]
MSISKLCKGAGLSALAIAGPAAATALAPFVLHTPGAVEIKFSGYLARSGDSSGGPGTREASFGAGYMTSIHELGNPANQLWHTGQDNQNISFMMYGAADSAVLPVPGSPAHQVYGAGCTHAAFGCDGKIHLDFYLDKLTGGTNPGFGLGGIKASQRQGFNHLGGITDGTLLMRWEFVPGLAPSAPGGAPATLFQQLSGVTSPSSGFGSYLARCAGGPACRYFASGMQQSGADFYGTSTMTSILALSAIGQNGWSTRLSDPVVAQVALPLPASSSLLALGAGAMVLVRRRRQRV